MLYAFGVIVPSSPISICIVTRVFVQEGREEIYLPQPNPLRRKQGKSLANYNLLLESSTFIQFTYDLSNKIIQCKFLPHVIFTLHDLRNGKLL